jgi:DNA modification methylase
MAERRNRDATATSAFGVSKRENHDSTSFYERFPSPTLLTDSTVVECPVKNTIFAADSRDLSAVPDNSVALVVTSPPYFAGKAYEAELGEGHVPASYLDYLVMLRDVFTECWRVLEPGGRIAINVANLGRKPYRSLAGDVTTILQDDLGFLLRGEIVWIKADGASGNCAWGSYASAANPVLRDLTERIIIASKGRFDRALKRSQREEKGLPFENSIAPEDFMAWTLDTWKFQPESAKRVGHPAPYPVELPRRAIELFTYVGDTVLDPFMGAGQTAIAAIRTGRNYVGFDIDPEYVALAERRIAEERGNA